MDHTENILSIKQLTRYIKTKLEGDIQLQNVWVRGEISNFTHHSRGHMYFTLKDADSRVRCVMFASHNQRLGFIPREGTRVIARGNIAVYERDGQYQYYVTEMQPDGIGNLYLAFEQLKKKLEEEGLFSSEFKKPIPSYPQAIGVITSPTGAAIRDIVTTIQRRYPTANILLYPVLVQGTHAAPSIVKAIEALNRESLDVLIVGRGGGSLEELWAFNEEAVARSIFASRIPVISAVGHETDFTIADFVADIRAATPTAAAELAVPHHLELKQQITTYRQRLQQELIHKLQGKQEQLKRLRQSPVLLNPQKQLQQPYERLDRLTEQLQFKMNHHVSKANEKLIKRISKLSVYNPKEQVDFLNQKVNNLQRQLFQSIQYSLKAKKQHWISHIRHLDALSPLKVMQRGYSLVYDEKQKYLIKSLNQIQIGDILKLKLTDGQADCHVWAMEENKDE